MWTTPSASGAVVSAAISSAFSALRASPSESLARWRSAGFVGLNLHVAQPALRVGQRALQQAKQILLGQRPQFENLRARDERRVDEEKRIVRRRADQPDDAALHVRQQHVLLRFVEAMDFVNEQDRRLAGVLAAGLPPPASTRRMSATLDSTPLSRSNLLLVWRAMICASDVLPVPGGPKKISDWMRSASMARRSNWPGPRMCVWPTNSLRLRGRMRAASGWCRCNSGCGEASGCSTDAAANRSSRAMKPSYQLDQDLPKIKRQNGCSAQKRRRCRQNTCKNGLWRVTGNKGRGRLT